MNKKSVEKWVWVLVYGGLIGVALGVSVERSDSGTGWGIASVGALAVAAGVVMIYLRSRMKGTP